ncbi:hypothetical protein HPB47_019365 [Ixodes persulcatus]|uniref:Uncharacterized protein n=1 Tax=Ixodes persulcatus TaxID=34615 RepID=A0AC60QID1_IXOPE|nr:hypothetical protein HPB47_019365 [Ixodes persulcatus]
MPRLPKEHFRVIVRPWGGLNVKNASQVKIAQALVTAAGLSFSNCAEDIICANAMQNILVVSTPSEHNAKTYGGLKPSLLAQQTTREEKSEVNTARYFRRWARCLNRPFTPGREWIPGAGHDQGALERAIRGPTAAGCLWGPLSLRRPLTLRGIGGSHPKACSQGDRAPKPAKEETPMEVPVEAPSKARTAKKRALTEPVPDEGLEGFQTEMRNVGAVPCHNLNEDLGSDHNILATCISVKSKPLKEFTITDWDQFRKSREERALIQDSSIDLERWATQLKGDLKSATKTVQTDLEIARMDSRLAHLLEAKKELLDNVEGPATQSQAPHDDCGAQPNHRRPLPIPHQTAMGRGVHLGRRSNASRRRGNLREDNLLSVFNACLMSHITYVVAMHCCHGSEKKKTLSRSVLAIPMQASTERVMQLGVHSTLEEIIEGQETAQKMLAVLGLNPTLVAERRHHLSDTQRASIQTSPFPRNVHPQHNVDRRRARAVALLRHVRDEPLAACFVDAAQYGRSSTFAAVVIDHKGLILNSASFIDSTPSRAELTAIALALLDDSRSHIYTDYRSASTCPECGSVSSFDHMLWRCPSLRGPNQVTEEEWSSAITSSELLPQLRAVQRAHDAAVRLSVPVPTWERPAVLL